MRERTRTHTKHKCSVSEHFLLSVFTLKHDKSSRETVIIS